jgi:hypothetical protein
MFLFYLKISNVVLNICYIVLIRENCIVCWGTTTVFFFKNQHPFRSVNNLTDLRSLQLSRAVGIC